MKRLKNVFFNIYSTALLLLSFYFLFLLVGSGHSIELKDFAQMRFLFEILIFLLAAIGIFIKKQLSSWGRILIVVLLLMVELSLIDIYVQASKIDYSEGDSKPFFLILALFFLSTFILLFSFLRTKGRY